MRALKMNNKQLNDLIIDIRNQLKTYKSMDSNLQFTLTLPEYPDKAPALVKFTDTAWKKIKALVSECDKEVAWHGTVSKDNNNYLIEDILVFPQTVTGATVTSDETEYSKWLMEQPNEVFNKLRFHGHSHVNMGVSPSTVDTQYQQDILRNLQDFYIFAIFNKRGNLWITICDIAENTLYENEDIIVESPDSLIEDWAKEQIKTHVATKEYARQTYQFAQKAAEKKEEEKSELDKYVDECVQKSYDKTGKKVNTPKADIYDDDYDYYGRYYKNGRYHY